MAEPTENETRFKKFTGITTETPKQWNRIYFDEAHLIVKIIF